MNSLSESLQRLVTEIDGWLELRCNDRALERLDVLLAEPRTRSIALLMRIRAYVGLKRHKEALADITELRAFAAVGKKHDLASEWCRSQLAAEAELGGTDALSDWLDLTEAWCRKRMHDLQAATECMERLLRRNGRSGIGHFNLGCYLALAGETERALDEVTVACGIHSMFRDMLHDEPDLDALRDDARFLALMKGKRATDPAEAAAEADAFEDDMAEGFEDDLEFDDDEEDDEFDEDFDGDDEDEDEDEAADDDEPPPPRGAADGTGR